MPRLSLSELERRCQKPDYRTVGNWMARRLVRPAALRVTWLVAPWGISANAATLAAWCCGLASVLAFGWGSAASWLVGAILLQSWYLLDHVDGQLARLRGTASLDGVQLDYLMHHTISLLVPIGVGYGAAAAGSGPWSVLGIAWGVGALVIGLEHDTRAKAFFQRLERLEGDLYARGGGGGRSAPQPAMPRQTLRWASWLARKLCEQHVVMNLLALLALVVAVLPEGWQIVRGYLFAMSLVAPAVAAWSLGRAQLRRQTEAEFTAWFPVPPGARMVRQGEIWRVEAGFSPEDSEDALTSVSFVSHSS